MRGAPNTCLLFRPKDGFGDHYARYFGVWGFGLQRPLRRMVWGLSISFGQFGYAFPDCSGALLSPKSQTRKPKPGVGFRV